MGMSASQARLLTLTSRIHDVEYQAQSIQNAKLALATQSDQVYQDYLQALDETTLTVKDNNQQTVVATFNSLCGINSVNVGNFRYALKDAKGRLIVDPEIAKGYNEFKKACSDPNPYNFAIYMISGGEVNFNSDEKLKALKDIENKVANDVYSAPNEALEKQEAAIKDMIAEYYSDNNGETIDSDDNMTLPQWLSQIDSLPIPKDLQKAIDDYKTLQDESLYKLYRGYSEDICKEFDLSSLYDESDFQYYADMFRQIEANGGSCVSFNEISNFDGIDGIGDAANDSEWLKKQIECGNITVDTVKVNKYGKAEFNATGVPSDDRLEYTTTSTIDKTKLAKVEAKYEHDMKIINQKDKKFDLDLNKLETERGALTKEYESVQKVIEDNIQRTFGIFS